MLGSNPILAVRPAAERRWLLRRVAHLIQISANEVKQMGMMGTENTPRAFPAIQGEWLNSSRDLVYCHPTVDSMKASTFVLEKGRKPNQSRCAISRLGRCEYRIPEKNDSKRGSVLT